MPNVKGKSSIANYENFTLKGKEYYELYKKGYRIQLEKVKGHSGVKWNEVADRLASADGDKEHDKWKEKIITVSTT